MRNMVLTLTRPQSSLSVSPYWREGCDGKDESEGESFPPFSLPITPAPVAPVTRRRLGTSQCLDLVIPIAIPIEMTGCV